MKKPHDDPRRTDHTRCMPQKINHSRTEDATVVQTRRLSKRFGSGFLAVDGVDMSVRRGEVDPPAFGPSAPSAIAANQAVLVLAVYFIGLIVVAAGLLRLRDVS